MLFIQMWMLQAKLKLKEFCTKENGDVNVVSIVVLIGIAVVLAMIFKDAISDLLDTLFKTIEGNAENAISREN